MTSSRSKESIQLLQPSSIRSSVRSSNRGVGMSKVGGMSLYIKNIIAKKIMAYYVESEKRNHQTNRGCDPLY